MTPVSLTERRTEEGKRIRRERFKSGEKDWCPRGEKEYVPRTDGKVNTLTTGGAHERVVLTKEMLRKLHPIECERLQCLPDDYTAGQSFTQRYKACGNAFNVDVVAHIISFIKKDESKKRKNKKIVG